MSPLLFLDRYSQTFFLHATSLQLRSSRVSVSRPQCRRPGWATALVPPWRSHLSVEVSPGPAPHLTMPFELHAPTRPGKYKGHTSEGRLIVRFIELGAYSHGPKTRLASSVRVSIAGFILHGLRLTRRTSLLLQPLFCYCCYVSSALFVCHAIVGHCYQALFVT